MKSVFRQSLLVREWDFPFISMPWLVEVLREEKSIKALAPGGVILWILFISNRYVILPYALSIQRMILLSVMSADCNVLTHENQCCIVLLICGLRISDCRERWILLAIRKFMSMSLQITHARRKEVWHSHRSSVIIFILLYQGSRLWNGCKTIERAYRTLIQWTYQVINCFPACLYRKLS